VVDRPGQQRRLGDHGLSGAARHECRRTVQQRGGLSDELDDDIVYFGANEE